MFSGGVTVNLADEDDIILHGRCKSTTLQCSLPNTLKEHRSETDVILVGIDTIDEENQKINGGLVQQVSLFDGNVVHHMPWILL